MVRSLGLIVLLAGSAAGVLAVGPGGGAPSRGARVAEAQQAPSEKPPFDDWLEEVRAEALANGISQATIDHALTGIEPLPVVVERDRTQAEHVLPLDVYLKRRLTPKTVRTARRMAREHRSLLRRVSGRYGVPSGIIVSIWGLESTFGRFTGTRPTVTALATLAYDNRRAAMFRAELFDALRILDAGDIEIGEMKGSWAGAMGQPQFMPSSYLKYAVDFDGDRRRDIWASRPDAFASIANYLKEHGWTKGTRWGRAVRVPAAAGRKIAAAAPLRTEGCVAARQMTAPLPLKRWQALGVRLENGQPLPAGKLTASLVRAGSRRFLVFANYETLLEYNCAHAYALSVALLADRIGS